MLKNWKFEMEGGVCKQGEKHYLYIQGIVSSSLKYFLSIRAFFLKVSLLVLQPSGLKHVYCTASRFYFLCLLQSKLEFSKAVWKHFPPCVGMQSWKSCAEMSVLICACHCLTRADGVSEF